MNTDYTITLTINADEEAMLKEALLAYTKSNKVTLINFDLARNLYGKITVACSLAATNVLNPP